MTRPNLWRAIPLRELISDVVLGALDDRAGESRAIAIINDSGLAGLPLDASSRQALAGERDRDALVLGLDPTVHRGR